MQKKTKGIRRSLRCLRELSSKDQSFFSEVAAGCELLSTAQLGLTNI